MSATIVEAAPARYEVKGVPLKQTVFESLKSAIDAVRSAGFRFSLAFATE